MSHYRHKQRGGLAMGFAVLMFVVLILFLASAAAPDQIETARIVTNRWYYGWGVRLYPGGWLYNVAGFDAVEVSLRNGKSYRIGTDEPEALLTTIENAAR